MKQMNIKEKKPIAPNEASLFRWIGVLVVSLLISNLISIPMAVLKAKLPESFLGVDYDTMNSMVTFAGLFVSFVISLKLVGKTSLKDFVLGVGGTVNKKENLTIMGLYVAGFFLAYVPFLGNVQLHGVKAEEFGFLVLFMLMFLWMQTSVEELLFRGILIRWTCKNKPGFTKKSVIVLVLTAVAFGLSHAGNVEVTSLNGIRAVMAIATYCISGVMYFVVDLYFGSLLPGLLIHWVNNFMVLVIISEEVSAISVKTLLLDTTPHSAEVMMLSKILTWLPVLVYILLDARKKKKTV
jgi:membrane protease YdiL (CAAX protease family)